MEFRILGPVEVSAGGRPITLRGQKQRGLLALLLLRAGEVVSTDWLVEELWGGRPPKAAVDSLQNRIAELRKALGRDRIRTRPSGYVLVVDREETDLGRFERLLAEARAEGDAGMRAEKLGQALALWRGRPLADLAFEPFAHAEIARLEELRLTAQEEFVEARLELGQHAQLVSELESLVAAQPLRERLRGQLMLALYRSGRQAEALAAYQQARRTLVEELGVEPSPALQHLEQAILRQHKSLDVEPASALAHERPGTALRSGTVTFLFTDIEGSTGLLRELGQQAYAEALAEHRRLLREAFGAHGGVEVDTQGDALFYVFARASDALAAAEAAQRRLADPGNRLLQGRVRVRIGVHTGEPIVTEEGYVGADVHLGARVMSAAHGGQVLVSESTARLVDAELRDLGEHRLKDVERRVRLFQLGDGRFPALRTLNNSNLQFPATALLGRKKELADVLRLLGGDRARLVTLTGPGGIGKTRLALAAAHELVEIFADGVWFVDLSPLRDPALVAPTIVAALGGGGGLVEHVGDKELLLVLDNVEQVIEAASDLAELLRRCARVRLLLTSREPIRLAGEREYPLKPLAESPAVELFRERAQSADPEFGASWDTLTAIVDRLDRLPLAIELAASHVAALDAGALLRKLERRLPVLTGRRRDAPARQRTLRSAIDWSYELLTPDEQAAFARLSVFEGAFDLDAAEEVATADFDAVASLVEKSLVRRRAASRYGFFETIHEYGRERLAHLPDVDALRARHAEWFADVADALSTDIWENRASLAAFDAVAPDVRAALAWLRQSGDSRRFVQLTVAASNYWVIRGFHMEAREWLASACEHDAGASPDDLAYAHAALSAILHWSGDDTRARVHADRAVELARRGSSLAHALNRRASLLTDEDALAAHDLYRRAAAAAREAGDVRWEGVSLVNESDAWLVHKEWARASAVAAQALRLFRSAGNDSGVAMAHVLRGWAALGEGRVNEAAAGAAESVRLLAALGQTSRLGASLDLAAAVAAERGASDRAAELLGAADATRRRFGAGRATLAGSMRPSLERALEEALDAAALTGALERGAELEHDDVIELALEVLR